MVLLVWVEAVGLEVVRWAGSREGTAVPDKAA